MTSELLSEVKQAYYVLKEGGPPRKIIEILVALIEGALSVCFILQEGAREQIETELEYLLEKLGESRIIKPSFICERFRCLFSTLLRDKRIVPRTEATFSSLLPPQGIQGIKEEGRWEEQLFKQGIDWEDVEVELPHPAPYQPQEKTLLRKMRLYRLKNWTVGCLLHEKPQKLVQGELF